MTGEIRRLRASELADSFTLSQYAFQIELSQEQLQEKMATTRPEEIWGYFVAGKLAAKARVIPLQTCIQGQTYNMGGIAGVATWPEYRRSGMVGKLLARCLEAMRDAGQTISFLAPFSFGFYRKYGWEMLTEYKKITVDVSMLPNWERPAGRVERVGEDTILLNGIYERYAQNFNCMLLRSSAWWEQTVFAGLGGNGQAAVYFAAPGEPAGYLIYEVKDRVMEIREFVFLDERARRALWRFIRDHDSMLQKVVMKAPIDDQLAFLLDNPRIGQEIVPYFMGRIVDVPAFLKQYRFAAGVAGEVVLHVHDEYAPWNNGSFTVAWDGGGRTNVRALKTAERLPAPSLETDIQALSAVLTGYQRPAMAAAAGRIRGNIQAVGLLEQAIPRSTTYLLDFF